MPTPDFMKLLQDIRLPVGLEPEWTAAFMEELRAADKALPKLSPAALELAALAASGEYDARIVGQILDRDQKLRDQVVKLANSVVYGGNARIETSAEASQRIGMRALYEIAVVEVARVRVFGPALGQVLGGSRMWSIAKTAGAISHAISARKLGSARASILSGLILNVGPPLAHQLVRRVEEKAGSKLASRTRRELTHRVAPGLSVALIDSWELSPAIAEAARALGDGQVRMPESEEARIAVLSISLARFINASPGSSLAVPARWPTTQALGLDEAELTEILEAASAVDEFELVA